jgi:hypothetical protein
LDCIVKRRKTFTFQLSFLLAPWLMLFKLTAIENVSFVQKCCRPSSSSFKYPRRWTILLKFRKCKSENALSISSERRRRSRPYIENAAIKKTVRNFRNVCATDLFWLVSRPVPLYSRCWPYQFSGSLADHKGADGVGG